MIERLSFEDKAAGMDELNTAIARLSRIRKEAAARAEAVE
jgi:hypothetical protein